jgi:hypothetical protein
MSFLRYASRAPSDRDGFAGGGGKGAAGASELCRHGRMRRRFSLRPRPVIWCLDRPISELMSHIAAHVGGRLQSIRARPCRWAITCAPTSRSVASSARPDAAFSICRAGCASPPQAVQTKDAAPAVAIRRLSHRSCHARRPGNMPSARLHRGKLAGEIVLERIRREPVPAAPSRRRSPCDPCAPCRDRPPKDDVHRRGLGPSSEAPTMHRDRSIVRSGAPGWPSAAAAKWHGRALSRLVRRRNHSRCR